MPSKEGSYLTVSKKSKKSVYDLGLCIHLHDNFLKQSSIGTNLVNVKSCYPNMNPIENHIRRCYTFSTGSFKRNPVHYYVNGCIYWK